MSKAKTRIVNKWASAPLLQQARALCSAFPAKELLCLPLPAQPPAPALWMSPAPLELILVQSTCLDRLQSCDSEIQGPLLCHPHCFLCIHFCCKGWGWLQACNGNQFTLNYEQLRQSHLHSSGEPLHQYPGWLSGKLILINFWAYSRWCSLCYSLAAPDQSGSGHVYGSMVL